MLITRVPTSPNIAGISRVMLGNLSLEVSATFGNPYQMKVRSQGIPRIDRNIPGFLGKS